VGIVGIVHGSVSALLYFVMGRRDRGQGLTLHGVVAGQATDNILLITACSRSLVWRELVPKEKILPEQVLIRCAHEDTVMYSLANIEQLGGMGFVVEPTVTNH